MDRIAKAIKATGKTELERLAQAVLERRPMQDETPSLPISRIISLEWLQQHTGRAFDDLDEDIAADRYREYWLKGGRGSLKSSYISLKMVHGIMSDASKGIHSNGIAIRKIGVTLADSVYEQLIWAVDTLGATDYWEIRKSPLELIYKPTRQKIVFRGADDPSKNRSIKVRKGFFGYIWFEEANQFRDEEELKEFQRSLIRGTGQVCIFASYNPPASLSNWINAASGVPKEDRKVHVSTYLLAPPEWLGEVFLAEAEHTKEHNEKAYRHTYLGEAVGIGGSVFDNIEVRTIHNEEINEFEKTQRGLDFGFAVDPSVYIECALVRGVLYLFNEWASVGARYDRMATEIKSRNKRGGIIMADSSDPRSIAELRSRGLNVQKAKKGPDSVESGIAFLQGLDKIVIDPLRCPTAYREFTSYEYDLDKDGRFIASYPDRNNHSIDAVRYAIRPLQASGNRAKAVRGLRL